MRTKNKTGLSLFLIAAAFCLLLPAVAVAQVSGPCGDCHTMHGSQDGVSSAVMDQLLADDCVGCHTNSTNGDTILDPLGTRIPVVFNSFGGPTPGTMLAGGNFYWVRSLGGDDRMGHNVKGISGQDSNLSSAPGTIGGVGCATSCHTSLAVDVIQAAPSGADQTGCQGCHLRVGHHAPADNSGGAGDAYRFLGSHGAAPGIVDNGLNAAFEDSDWEQDTVTHNAYKAQTVDSENQDEMSMGQYCIGCHTEFHSFGNTLDNMQGGLDNGGDRDFSGIGGGWLRHPTNVAFGGGLAGTEYDLVVTSAYDPQIPLARITSNMGTGSVSAFDQVFCLSCHRAHGSQYPDMLRFDYTSITAHSGGGRTDGCFFCHRLKDDP